MSATLGSLAECEQKYGQKVVAIVYNDDNTVADYTFNWESAQNYALSQGKKIIAVADDGYMSRDDIQRLCDAEKARYDDCFGATT